MTCSPNYTQSTHTHTHTHTHMHTHTGHTHTHSEEKPARKIGLARDPVTRIKMREAKQERGEGEGRGGRFICRFSTEHQNWESCWARSGNRVAPSVLDFLLAFSQLDIGSLMIILTVWRSFNSLKTIWDTEDYFESLEIICQFERQNKIILN